MRMKRGFPFGGGGARGQFNLLAKGGLTLTHILISFSKNHPDVGFGCGVKRTADAQSPIPELPIPH
jgi:hypothetical protein